MDKYDAECIIGTTKQFLMAAGGMLDIYRFEKDRESVLYAIFESYGSYFANARYFNACVDFIMSVDGGKDIYLPDMKEIDKLCNSIEFNSEDWKYNLQDRLHSIIVSIASGARRFIEFANKLPGAASSVEDAGTPAVEGDASSEIMFARSPYGLDTDEARKYFSRAIEKGFMEKTDNGFKWLYGGNRGQIRLGYFCSKVYNIPRPINALEEAFGVKKLSSSISIATECQAVRRADARKWRDRIDSDIFFD